MATPLETRIGYTFRKAELFTQALTHPSLAQAENNQRLEFLGDAVLGMVVAKLLYTLYPNENEGELARRHAALVCGSTLAQVASDDGLGAELRMSASEETASGRQNPTNLEDACEALIGALYLDGGIEAAERYITSRWTPLAKLLKIPPKDAKTALQEWAQGRGLPIPIYAVVETSGPAHAPLFTVEAQVEGHAPATANAPSKKAAEQKAAAELLERFAQE